MQIDSSGAIQIIFFSDTHLGFDYPLRPRSCCRRRGQDFFRNFETVLSYAIQQKADLVVHGGDLFFRSRVPGCLIDKAYAVLLDFTRSGIPLFIVPGNHERSQLPQSMLLRHPNIQIFNEPRTYTYDCCQGSVYLSGFPFERVNIRKHFKGLLKSAGWNSLNSGLKLLCLHQAIEGACVGANGYIFKSGSEVIRQSDLPEDAHVVLAGHIHRGQELLMINQARQDRPPVLFSGSTERTSFAEKDEIKGFYHLIFSRGSYGEWQMEQKYFIALATRPMQDFMLDPFQDAPALEAAINKNRELIDKNAIIRFNVRGRLKPALKPCLNTAWIRQRLPATVNFQLSQNLFK